MTTVSTVKFRGVTHTKGPSNTSYEFPTLSPLCQNGTWEGVRGVTGAPTDTSYPRSSPGAHVVYSRLEHLESIANAPQPILSQHTELPTQIATPVASRILCPGLPVNRCPVTRSNYRISFRRNRFERIVRAAQFPSTHRECC